MIDIALFIARVLLVVLLYLFLFAVMKTGIGQVKGQRKKQETWNITVIAGAKELRGVKIPIVGPLVVGRAPGSDIMIPEQYASARHARFAPMGDELTVEDLGTTNGTRLNGMPIMQMTNLQSGDVISIGDTQIQISKN
jgi:hypothetical protein